MTATGVVILVIGLFLAQIYRNPNPFQTNTAEWIAGAFILAGGTLVTTGVVVWLWRVMP